ncbi:MAG: HD domain-containing protein [Oscillospiraceae bacterium]|nr:HD domain-containing protein [Oscillospiraceae bacterium]
MINKLKMAMIEYFAKDAKRIQHFLKVHELAGLIAAVEGLDEKTRLTVEAAAVVHDVGIKIGEKLYGVCTGKQQEQLGPPMAKRMLADAGFLEDVIERACYLVGHHHTYDNIDGIDLQILIEADFLVNLYEDGVSRDGIVSAFNSIFRTNTGRLLCKQMFGI